MGPAKRNKTFSNIGDLIVQSCAAAYAFMSLIYAIAVVIPTSSDDVYLTRIYPLVGYVSLIFSFTAVRSLSMLDSIGDQADADNALRVRRQQ